MGIAFDLIASFLAVVVVLTFHEFAHAFAAFHSGDPTPKLMRRLTLNPLRHFDLIGLIAFSFVGFGWAKPVPINPDNFKHYRRGLAWTATAGVTTNYIMAFLMYPLYFAVHKYLDVPVLSDFLQPLTYNLFLYSLTICVFNLLPFYPLDGFRIIEACSKRHGKFLEFLRKYGYYFLLFLIIESFICRIFTLYIGSAVLGLKAYTIISNLDILGWIMYFARYIFGYPITALWGLIPW